MELAMAGSLIGNIVAAMVGCLLAHTVSAMVGSFDWGTFSFN
jgi:hypothetical protein